MKLVEKYFDKESEEQIIKLFNLPICKIYSNADIKEIKILFDFIKIVREYFGDRKSTIIFNIIFLNIFFKIIKK